MKLSVRQAGQRRQLPRPLRCIPGPYAVAAGFPDAVLARPVPDPDQCLCLRHGGKCLGGVIVTAPTCGSAVMPALVYALRHEMFIGDRAIREAFLASAAVSFIAKAQREKGIAGAESGLSGVKSAWRPVWRQRSWPTRAALPVQGDRKRGGGAWLEHHLGITCDLTGICAIPLASSETPWAQSGVQRGGDHLRARITYSQRVSLDAAIAAMAETGLAEMSCKFKETSLRRIGHQNYGSPVDPKWGPEAGTDCLFLMHYLGFFPSLDK